MNKTMEKTIGQLVAEDYRTAQVFKVHKIDFCCRGNRTLSEVSAKKGPVSYTHLTLPTKRIV